MGEPLPGDIVDNIFTSVQQVVLVTGVLVAKGDILFRASTDNLWQSMRVSTPTVDTALLSKGLVQSRVDVTTSQDAGTAIEVLAAPSYIYGIAAASGMDPGDAVSVDTDGKFLALTTMATGLNIGRFSRLSIDQAGSNSTTAEDQVVIIKLGAT